MGGSRAPGAEMALRQQTSRSMVAKGWNQLERSSQCHRFPKTSELFTWEATSGPISRTSLKFAVSHVLGTWHHLVPQHHLGPWHHMLSILTSLGTPKLLGTLTHLVPQHTWYPDVTCLVPWHHLVTQHHLVLQCHVLGTWHHLVPWHCCWEDREVRCQGGWGIPQGRELGDFRTGDGGRAPHSPWSEGFTHFT